MVTPAAAGRPDADPTLHITVGMEVYDTFDHKLAPSPMCTKRRSRPARRRVWETWWR